MKTILRISLPLAISFLTSISFNAHTAQAAGIQKAGLYRSDGSVQNVPIKHAVSGRTIDITKAPYFADKTGKEDVRKALENAMNNAKAGDEIFFPDGKYLFDSAWTSDGKTNIKLKSGINIRGESRSKTFLISSFDDEYTSTKPAGANSKYVIRGSGVKDICISSLTVSSTWNRNFSLDTKKNSRDHGGPDVCILFSASASAYSENIVIEDVTVEKFLNIGIKMDKGCRNTLITKCVAQNATDVGGGGCGYGFQLNGMINNSLDNSENYSNPNLNTLKDNYFNTIDSCSNGNKYIRHGALIQYWAHNNRIINCTFDSTQLDSIDLHGEDEYLNEIMFNTIRNSLHDSAIGLGNSGGTSSIHDKSGPFNFIHDNTIVNCRRGITVQFGTSDTVIERNSFQSFTFPKSAAVSLGFAPNMIVRNNIIKDCPADGFSGIQMYKDPKQGNSPSGAPSGCLVTGNSIINNTNGSAFSISDQDGSNTFAENKVSGNKSNKLP